MLVFLLVVAAFWVGFWTCALLKRGLPPEPFYVCRNCTAVWYDPEGWRQHHSPTDRPQDQGD